MSTERGNYQLITVHAPFLAVAPNQKSLSNCCMEALSHWPEKKNSGRCSPWNFTKKYCAYMCHTLCAALQKFHSNHCLKYFCEFPNNISFSFLLQKNKPTQSATIVLTLWIYRTEDELQSCILVWRDSKKRSVHCPISGTEFDHFWNWFCKNKFPGAQSSPLEVNFRPKISLRPG